MTSTLLAPAAAIVGTVCVLAWALQRLETEVAALRSSMRRSRAAAVAADELRRSATTVASRATEIGHDARVRADLRRNRRRAAHR